MGKFGRLYDEQKKEENTKLSFYDKFVKENPERAAKLLGASQMPTDGAVSTKKREQAKEDALSKETARTKAIERLTQDSYVDEKKNVVNPWTADTYKLPFPFNIKNTNNTKEMLSQTTQTPALREVARRNDIPYVKPVSERIADASALYLGEEPYKKEHDIFESSEYAQKYNQQKKNDIESHFADKDVAEKPVSLMSDEEKQAVKNEYEGYDNKNYFERMSDVNNLYDYDRKQALYPNYREIKNEDAYNALLAHGMTDEEIQMLNGNPLSTMDARRMRHNGETDESIENIANEQALRMQEARNKFETLIASVDDSWGVTRDDIIKMVEDRYANPEVKELAKEDPVASTIYSWGANPIESAIESGANAYNYVTGKPLQNYQTTTELARNAITENIDSQFGRSMYGGIVAIGDTMVAAGIGAATGGYGAAPSIISAGIQALEKASQVMGEGVERNLNPDQIFAEGIASGVSTYITEKIPMGMFAEVAEKGLTNYTAKEIGKYLGAMFISEGLQESYEDVADWVIDGVLAWDKSEFYSDAQNYIKQGMSPEEAMQKVIAEHATEMMTDFFFGGLGGAHMGSMSTTIGYASGKYNNTPSAYIDRILGSPKALNEMVNAVNSIDTTNLVGEDLERVEKAKETANEIVDKINNSEGKDIKKVISTEELADLANVLNEQANAENRLADTINEINYQATYDQSRQEYKETGKTTPVEGETELEKAARQKAESIAVQEDKQAQAEQRQREKLLRDYQIKGLKSELGTALAKVSLEFENEYAAKTFLDNFKDQNAALYSTVSLQAYHAGESGQSFDTFLNNSVEAKVMLNNGVTESYLKTLFYQGQNTRTEDYSTDFKVAKNPNRGKATGDVDELTPLKQKIAEYFGVEVATDFEKAVTRGDFQVALAKIIVGANSDNQYAALMHEVFEFARAYNPKGMAVAEKAIVDMLVAKRGERAFVKAVNDYKNAYRAAGKNAKNYKGLTAEEIASLEKESNKSFSDAQEEFINDVISYIFSTDEGIKTFTDFIMGDEKTTQEEKVSAIQAIKDFVDHLVTTIKNFLSGTKNKQLGYEYARLANFSTEELENVSKYLTGVLQGAKEELARKSGETSGKAENTATNPDVVSNIEISTDELNKNLHVAHDMKSVDSIKYYDLKNTKTMDDAIAELSKYLDNEGVEYAESPSLGRVDIDHAGLRQVLNHGNMQYKASIINIVKPVIEKGKLVYADYRHSDRNYNTATIVAPIEFTNNGFKDNKPGIYYAAVVVKRSPADNVRHQGLHVTDILTYKKGLSRTGQSDNRVVSNEENPSLHDILEHVAADVNIFDTSKTIKFSLDVPVTSNQESTQDKINASMTMDECRDMLKRAFVSGDIKDYYEGEVKNADEWLEQDGAEVVAITVENDYALYQKFLSKIEGLDDDFTVEDIIEAYQNGTLTGGNSTKKETKRLDVSKEGRKDDQRFYAPKNIEDYKATYELANTKVTNKNREEVTKARAAILLFAHNKGAAELLGITEKDLNKALRNWGGYSAKAREVSMRINSGASIENRWTGIENMSWLNRVSVSNKELDNLCGDIKGDSNETQRAYIVRTMCALDTHIDYKGLNFIFSNEGLRDSNVRGQFSNMDNTITVRPYYPNTVAHEMGHYLDYLWGREITGGKLRNALTEIVRTGKDFGREDINTWANNFANFLESLEDVSSLRSSYTMDPKEVFARFVSKFVQWTDAIANGENRSFHETEFYNDKFTTSQFLEFARLLQEKSSLNLAEQQIDEIPEKRKFSVSVPIEQTKDLIAVHNLSDEKLRGVLELGGFPMPSIAITKAEMDHSKFGSISVIFRKDTIDPKKNRYNKVYSGDAYTPTFPTVEYKIDSDKVWDVEKKVEGILGKDYNAIGYSSLDPDNVSDSLNRWNGDYGEAFENNYTLKHAFLKDNGINVDLQYTEEPIYSKLENKEMQILNDRFLSREYLEEIAHDYEYGNKHPEELKKIRDTINEVVAMNNQDEIDDLMKQYRETGEKRYKALADDLSNFLDEYTFSSFDLRNFALALINYREKGKKRVVDQYKSRDEIKKQMEGREVDYKKWLNNLFDGVVLKKGLRNNKDMFTPSGNRRSWDVLHDDYSLENIVNNMRKEPATGQSFGGFSFFGSSTREFESIEDIKSESDRLQIMEESLYTEAEREIRDELFNIAGRIKPSGSWDTSSAVSDIAEAVSRYKTKSGVKNFLSKWYKVSDADIEEIMALAKRTKELPTGYFEAKPQRAVGLNEVAAIVIPSDDTEMINEVKGKGIPVVEYQRGDKQSRVDAVNSVEDIRFSVDVPADAFFEAFEEVEEKVKLDESDLEQFIKNGDLESDVTKKAVRDVASNIKKQYNSNIKLDRLSADIMSVFKYLKSTGKMSMKDIMFVMKEIARPVLEDVKASDPEQEKMYKDFISKLKGYKISLDAGQTAEVAHSFGSYYEFTRAMSGKMNLSKNGTPLDNIWTELCDISDGHLSYGTNPNDQPLALAEYIYGLQPSYQTMEGETLDDAATDLALEIFRQFYVYQSMTDAASKVKGELNKRANEYKNRYKKAYNDALKQVEMERNLNIERLAKELDNLTAEEQEALRTGDALNKAMIENLKADYQRRLDRLRAQSNEKIAREKAKYQNAWITKNLKRERSELKNRVLREVKALQNLIAHPSEGATKHVPINLIKPTIEMLEAINLDNGGRNKAIAERLKKMAEVYESFKGEEYSFDYDERIANDIKELREMFENKSYADLEIMELERVIEIVTALKTQIKNANNLILQGKLKDAQEAASSAMSSVRQSRRYDNAAMNALNKYANVHLNAYREFRKLSGYMGGALMDIYEDLDAGSKKEMQIQKDLGAIFQSVLEGKENQKEVKKFISTKKDDLVDIGLTDKNGKPILITRAMRMSLIMHSMNASNMRHVLGSGITIPNMYYFEKGKMDEAYAKGTNYRFVDYAQLLEAIQKNDTNKIEELTKAAEQRIEDMKKDLSPWEQKFLAAAEEMFHEKTGKYINETSLALKGYAIARVKNYFPIKTDAHFTNQEWAGLVQNGSLEGSGVLKERVVSTKPILLEDITNVIERQIRFTSKYAGLAIAVRNFETIMKQTSRSQVDGQLHNLYETIDSVWGASDTKWLKNLMQDIQGGRSEAKSWLMNLRGQFAGATLSLNPSVAIKQTASYPTAAAVVGYKALGKAMADMRKGFITQEGIKELEEINPLLWYRNQGNATQELADAKAVGFGKNLPQWAQKAINWTQWFDTGTVRTLEYASKYYVDENFKDLEKGSEEYWNKVSEVFTNVVEQTQPNYSTLHKADIIRNPNSFVKMLVMFKTQPMQNFGIVYDAMGELNAAKISGNKKWISEASSKAALAISSQAISATVFSAMTILSQLLLHRWWKYRDDEGKWSWEKFWVALGEGALSCFTGAFIGGSELYEALKHIFTGSTYYGIEVSVAEMVTDFVKNIGYITQNAKSLWDSKTEADRETAAQKLLKYSINLGSTVGEFEGTPVNNIKNMLSAMYFYATDIVNSIDEGKLTFSDDSNIAQWEIETQYERIYQSLNDPERYEKLVNELKDKAKADDPDLTEDEVAEKVEKNVETNIKKLVKKDYLEGNISFDEASDYLEGKGKTENEAFFQIREWETGESTYGVLKDSISEAAKNPNSQTRKAVIDEINVLLEHGKEKGDISSTLTRNFKQEYIDLYKQNKAADLNAILRTALVTMGYTDEEAKKRISDWVK